MKIETKANIGDILWSACTRRAHNGYKVFVRSDAIKEIRITIDNNEPSILYIVWEGYEGAYDGVYEDDLEIARSKDRVIEEARRDARHNRCGRFQGIVDEPPRNPFD